MLARLGEVLYLAGCTATAAIWLTEGVRSQTDLRAVVGALVSGAVIWLIGWACRYVLAGR
jgi:hypothetical protein